MIFVSYFGSGHFFPAMRKGKITLNLSFFFRLQDDTYVVKFVFVMLICKSTCTLKILVFFLMLLTAHHFINKQS